MILPGFLPSHLLGGYPYPTYTAHPPLYICTSTYLSTSIKEVQQMDYYNPQTEHDRESVKQLNKASREMKADAIYELYETVPKIIAKKQKRGYMQIPDGWKIITKEFRNQYTWAIEWGVGIYNKGKKLRTAVLITHEATKEGAMKCAVPGLIEWAKEQDKKADV
jgi:hypothetical protein